MAHRQHQTIELRLAAASGGTYRLAVTASLQGHKVAGDKIM